MRRIFTFPSGLAFQIDFIISYEILGPPPPENFLIEWSGFALNYSKTSNEMHDVKKPRPLSYRDPNVFYYINIRHRKRTIGIKNFTVCTLFSCGFYIIHL